MAVFLLLLPPEFFTMEIKERPDDGHQHVHGHPKLQANVVCKDAFFFLGMISLTYVSFSRDLGLKDVKNHS